MHPHNLHASERTEISGLDERSMSKDHQIAFKSAVDDMREGMDASIGQRLLENYGNGGFVYRFPWQLHDFAMKAQGSLLEMGSGLSTVVLGVVAEKLNTTLTTIESDQDWADRARRALDLCQIGTVEIKVGELPDHIGSLPPDIGFFFLDGPQDFRERALVFPRLDGRISDAIVLIDDVDELIAREFGLWCERFDRRATGEKMSFPDKESDLGR